MVFKVKFTLLFIFLFLNVVFMFSSLSDVKNKVKTFKLKNGIKFILFEKHKIPVVSFVTFVNVGSVNEPKGETGITHVFEHMAFKGTKVIGTVDYKKEKPILDEMDRVFEEILAIQDGNDENLKREKLPVLKKKFRELQKEAEKYVVNNEFMRILNENGAEGTNAQTASDYTAYFINLPSNRVELWAYMESDRILNPVMREFYKEKEVIKEERRMRVESNPIGKLIEEVQCTAFQAHPYHHPTIGFMSDIEHARRDEVKKLHDRYYCGKNITIAVVGDITLKELKKLADKYFSKIPSGKIEDEYITPEPPQKSKKIIEMKSDAQPLVLVCFHRPQLNSSENFIFDALTDILSGGNSSRLYKKLVIEEKKAIAVGALSGFPGNKYPNLYIVYAFPSNGVDVNELLEMLKSELFKLKKEKVTMEELEKVKKREKLMLVDSLSSNQEMAFSLAYYETIGGGWENLFDSLKRIDRITPEDILDVANKYFKEENMIIGILNKK